MVNVLPRGGRRRRAVRLHGGSAEGLRVVQFGEVVGPAQKIRINRASTQEISKRRSCRLLG
jgi:hypothetical protein